MERTRCGECQCWNEDHWSKHEAKPKSIDGNINFGVCERRGPTAVATPIWNTLYIDLTWIKKLIRTGLISNVHNSAVITHTRFDHACFEGVKKETETGNEEIEDCDTAENA